MASTTARASHGADAHHEANKDFEDKRAGRAAAAKPAGDHHEHEGEACACPYCDTALEQGDKAFFRACHIEFEECPACGGITKKGHAV